MSRFIKVKDPNQVHKLIEEVQKNKAILKNEIDSEVIGDQFAKKELEKQQAPTLEGLESIKKGILDVISPSQIDKKTGLPYRVPLLDVLSESQIDPVTGQTIRLPIKSILEDLLAKNSNDSIIKLVQQLEPIRDRMKINTWQLIDAIANLKLVTGYKQDAIIEQLKKMEPKDFEATIQKLQAQGLITGVTGQQPPPSSGAAASASSASSSSSSQQPDEEADALKTFFETMNVQNVTVPKNTKTATIASSSLSKSSGSSSSSTTLSGYPPPIPFPQPPPPPPPRTPTGTPPTGTPPKALTSLLLSPYVTTPVSSPFYSAPNTPIPTPYKNTTVTQTNTNPNQIPQTNPDPSILTVGTGNEATIKNKIDDALKTIKEINSISDAAEIRRLKKQIIDINKKLEPVVGLLSSKDIQMGYDQLSREAIAYENDIEELEKQQQITEQQKQKKHATNFDLSDYEAKNWKLGDKGLIPKITLKANTIIAIDKNDPTKILYKKEGISSGLKSLIEDPWGNRDAKGSINYHLAKDKSFYKLQDFKDYYDLMNAVGWSKPSQSRLPEKYKILQSMSQEGDNWTDDFRFTSGKKQKDIMTMKQYFDQQQQQQPPTGAGLTPSAPYKSFKMQPDGKFGNVWIDPNNLKKMILTVYDSKGKRLSNMPIPYDLYHLITKRFDTKRKYSAEAIDTFTKLLKHAGVEYGDSQSKKIKQVIGDVAKKFKVGWDVPNEEPKEEPKEEQKGGCAKCEHDADMIKVYDNVEDVCERLNVLLGQISAKNDNPSITNEISQLTEFLYKKGKINESEYKDLLKAFGIIE